MDKMTSKGESNLKRETILPQTLLFDETNKIYITWIKSPSRNTWKIWLSQIGFFVIPNLLTEFYLMFILLNKIPTILLIYSAWS